MLGIWSLFSKNWMDEPPQFFLGKNGIGLNDGDSFKSSSGLGKIINFDFFAKAIWHYISTHLS